MELKDMKTEIEKELNNKNIQLFRDEITSEISNKYLEKFIFISRCRFCSYKVSDEGGRYLAELLKKTKYRKRGIKIYLQ
jgi:hypothetical protein